VKTDGRQHVSPYRVYKSVYKTQYLPNGKAYELFLSEMTLGYILDMIWFWGW